MKQNPENGPQWVIRTADAYYKGIQIGHISFQLY